ncbi:MAG: hypothetical protein PHF72_10725 [Gammaproteobacteria bacterium]|nr:hypothetical protein [Gammaproteobacteria bacterium]
MSREQTPDPDAIPVLDEVVQPGRPTAESAPPGGTVEGEAPFPPPPAAGVDERLLAEQLTAALLGAVRQELAETLRREADRLATRLVSELAPRLRERLDTALGQHGDRGEHGPRDD